MPNSPLSRRERQIMDNIYQNGQATAAEVLQALPNPPGYSAVRGLLRVLEAKGHLRHEEQGKRYVYVPIQPRQNAARSALNQVLHTFFGDSLEEVVATLLSDSDRDISEEELARLAAMIAQAKEGGR